MSKRLLHTVRSIDRITTGWWKRSLLYNYIAGSLLLGWSTDAGVHGASLSSWGEGSLAAAVVSSLQKLFITPLYWIGERINDWAEESMLWGICTSAASSSVCRKLISWWRDLPQGKPLFPEMFILMAYVLTDWFFRYVAFTGFAGIWDELLFIMLIGTWLVRVGVYHLRPRFPWIVSATIGYCIVMFFIYLYNSPDNRVALEGLRVMVEYVFWLIAGINLLHSREQFGWLLDVFLVAATLAALYGIYQYVVGVEIPASWIDSKVETTLRTRVFSFIGSPNILGSFLVFSIPPAYAFLKLSKTRLKKYYYAGILLTMLACLVFTLSRGAWLAFLFAIMLTGFWIDKKIIVALLLFIAVVPVVLPSVYDRMNYMMSSDYMASSEKGGRIGRWTKAIDQWEKQPETGVGLGRYGGAVAARYYPEDSFYVDSWYLKVGVESGWLGLASTIAILLAAMHAAKRALDKLHDKGTKLLGLSLLAGMAGVLSHNFVENVFEVPMMAVYFWLFCGLLIALPYTEEKQSKPMGS